MNPKLLFRDILRGYSIVKNTEVNQFSSLFSYFYLKHISHFDLCELEEIYEKSFAAAINNGFPLKADREKEIISNGEWTKEKQLKDELFMLETLNTNIKKTAKISDIERGRAEIEKTESTLKSIRFEKHIIMGQTAENFADKKMNEQFLFVAAKKDSQLTQNFFTAADFDDLTDKELNYLSSLCKDSFDTFSQRNLQKIALSGFFREYFSLCDNDPVKFYGKNVLSLTYNQSRLFYHGIEMTNILRDVGSKLPPEYAQDPDKIIDYYFINKNVEEVKAKNKDGNFNPVGFNSKDLKAVGLQNQMVDMNKMLKKHGGKMTQEEMLKEGIL